MSDVGRFTVEETAKAGSANGFRYNRLQRTLHWSMAAMILLAIALGIVAAYLPVGQQPRQGLLEIHKSLGITVFILAVLRAAYRLFRGEPPYREALGPLTHLASRSAHAALYALMLLMPITGYVFSAAGGYSLPWFGLFQWPRLLPHDMDLAHWGQWLHDKTAWIIGGVVVLHIAAVVWHVTIKRDGVLARMR
ncbi:MAG TPA: cytochrome b [Xanthobacteraceae bacterium]|jgi:cytochrome b561